jgi:N-acetyl-anhydromuramyl-L-alanine amidase AmpD
MSGSDYRRAHWYGAHPNNYTPANRPSSGPINKIVIHVTQGSFSSAINWFKNGSAYVSAHYTVRSSDGFIGQSVHEKDIAWHAGNWEYNKTSIGIEHEGYVSDPSWFTDAMYRYSARLSAYLCKKYKIPIDRTHIIGHNEVPGATHTDPGRYWDWNKYMRLVRSYAVYRQVVDNATSGRFSAASSWGTSSWNSQRYGKDYRYTMPRQVNDSARFKIRIPRRGNYDVFARWPAHSGYNPRTPFLIRTSNGWVRRVCNQRKNGGRWVKLGTFAMDAGDAWWIRVHRMSAYKGYIIADAVMVREA